ncbi:unnamed protein product [Rotaria socialis]|uniref:Uncharacterized protein n=2 Tax=Rotaria socialis TaxID=392032 RepID=A0A820VN20_9BILA|nr:unnamed protein product [Rotaria socialis]
MPHKFDDSNDDLYRIREHDSFNSITVPHQSLMATSSSSNISTKVEELIPPIDIKDIILNLKVEYNYPEIYKFIEELKSPNNEMKVNNRILSVSQLYTLHILNDLIDMSNQTIRKIYRPTLFIRKNDAFGPFNHYYLLKLFDIEYECPNKDNFPKVWKVTVDTNVIVNVLQLSTATNFPTEANSNAIENDTATLIGTLRAICENINTIDHLRSITKDDWDKLNKITHVVKQLIRDYMQINSVLGLFNQSSDPYKESTATLLDDIHRIRRYFYYVIKKLDLIPYLSRQAVDLAINEVRKTYDDDGNILINIQNYLRTFCLKNKVEDQLLYEQNKRQWIDEIRQLKRDKTSSDQETEQCRIQLERLQRDLKTTEKRTGNIIRREAALIKKSTEGLSRSQGADNIIYQKEKNKAIKFLEKDQKELAQQTERYVILIAKASSIKKNIECLEKLMELKLEEQHKR